MRASGLLSFVVFATSFACEGEPFVSDSQLAPLVAADCYQCHGRRTAANAVDQIADDIIDTHYDDQKIDADGNFVVEETPLKEGYILLQPVDWAEPGTGYVLDGDDNACAASCHDGHDTDRVIGQQWAHSGHADLSSPGVDREFPVGVCQQCHSSIGFAKWLSPSNPAFPRFIPPDDLYVMRLTCNGCHDGSGYPSAEDSRLRYTSTTVSLRSGSGAPPTPNSVVDGVIDAGGPSALCISCHQARQSGASLFKLMDLNGGNPYDPTPPNMVFGVNFSQFDSHGGHAGANQYGFKGYEYPGKRYTVGNVMHQAVNCIGCHMYESEDHSRGGHTNHPAGCERCHGVDWEEFDQAGRLMDLDGDGVFNFPKAEIEGLKQLLIDELAAGGVYYNVEHFPFAFTTDVEAAQIFPNAVFVWQERQMLAIFNLHFVNDDPGIFVHNLRYAAQLLRDSYEDLSGTTLPGTRPGTPDDRPAFDYSTF